ncbi:ABC transporter permease [Cryptosporangium phraense]|uniref:ABC transporter permease n=1 Tax=Cryptosporangium phraense TaxID=2593070 RepID=A0A545APX8_9ACTN|nr:ABC transporter permease [Cryptosporangium phraense]TQS43364.1 ABC transporter permease [Cryptosporangium phraense]
MLRFELVTQLKRLRTLIALLCLAAVPVAAGLALASSAGHRNGRETGLFGASPYSALNHTMASLEFAGPLLLPIVVGLLAATIASADRDWGVLRYLYVAPVTRTRLLLAKVVTVEIATATAVGSVLAAGLIAGSVIYGWHPFHRIGAPSLGAVDTLVRVLVAVGYVLLCMSAMAAIAFTLGLLLPRGAEALAVAIIFVVVASFLNGQANLHVVAAVLPVHYWQSWTRLFELGPTGGLALGAIVQLATIGVCLAACWAILGRRDPAA